MGPSSKREIGSVLKQSTVRNVFFDLDGTLTDSREGIVKCIQYTLTKLGLPSPPEEDLIGWIGPALQDTFAKEMGSTEKEDVDREHDILGAKTNRVAGIGVSWGYGSIEELELAGAIRICHEPEALLLAI